MSYGAIAGYFGGRIDNFMMRIVDIIYAIPYILIVIVLLSVFGGPNTPNWITWLSAKIGGAGNQGLSQIFLLFFALGLVSWLTMAASFADRSSLKNQEFVMAAKATGVSTFGIIFQASCSERSRAGDRLRDADRSERDADRGFSLVSRPRRSGPVCLVGQPCLGRHKEYRDLPMAADLSRRDDGPDAVFTELPGRRPARCTRSANAKILIKFNDAIKTAQFFRSNGLKTYFQTEDGVVKAVDGIIVRAEKRRDARHRRRIGQRQIGDESLGHAADTRSRRERSSAARSSLTASMFVLCRSMTCARSAASGSR